MKVGEIERKSDRWEEGYERYGFVLVLVGCEALLRAAVSTNDFLDSTW